MVSSIAAVSTARPDARAAAAHDVGIGLRQPHYAEVIEGLPALGFVEVHAENFFADGGAALAMLRQARGRYPVSLHGVGLALGSAAGLDRWHLDRLARLVERIEPVRVSDHASFARVVQPGGTFVHANDLLPIAFTEASLDILAANIDVVQERLRRPILVENLSAYVAFADDSIAEREFFARLCRRTGCGLLLDVNNLMVNALNGGTARGQFARRGGRDDRAAGAELEPRDARAAVGVRDPAAAARALARCRAFVDALPHGIVGELHVAGYAEAGALVIDDHGSRVRAEVWSLCAHALQRFGPLPVLVEWDTDVPALAVLLDEAGRAATIAAAAHPLASAA